MRILVLRGGPDRERSVSLSSGANVAAALREAGHDVTEADAMPGDLSALDGPATEAVFPVLHGRWGEGGPLQDELERRGLRYVGCGPESARRCMDKAQAKRAFDAGGLPTPPWRVVSSDQPTPADLPPPVVVKALDEGSSFATVICRDADAVEAARAELADYDRLLVERFVAGRELTVSVVAGRVAGRTDEGPLALPTIEIVPPPGPASEGFYDFHAKYESEATAYRFDIDLPRDTLDAVERLAVAAYTRLGVRHIGRVDFMIDADARPWLLEINTMPGFTSHSLLPMAARRAGIELPTLCDRLARLAASGR